jgi:hypothetical protein
MEYLGSFGSVLISAKGAKRLEPLAVLIMEKKSVFFVF